LLRKVERVPGVEVPFAKALVRQGVGVTIADEITARSGAMTGIRQFDLQPALTFEVGLLHFDSMPLSVGASRFAKHLDRVLKGFLTGP
jgi:sulfate adenylyltransferase subunit 1 (EFTu-like GTPase family)